MTTSFGELTVEEAAKEAAGNWRNFECFVWHRQSEIADPDNWAIMYTHHRDSGLLDQSNASVIEKTLEPFTIGDDPDVVFERHFHWAVGHIDGFSIRVYPQRRNHRGVPDVPGTPGADRRLPGPRRRGLQRS